MFCTAINLMDTSPLHSTQFGIEAIAYFEWDKTRGIALKKARDKQNISLRNLAKKIEEQTGVDFSFRYIGSLENGQSESIKKDKLLAITKALGISLNDLYL
jgi:DNA-binding Xre family transcriptional regulator